MKNDAQLRRLFLILPLLLTGMFVACCFSQTVAPTTKKKADHSMLIVVNKADHTIGMVDPASAQQIAVIPANGDKPHEAAVSPDGRMAYVPIYGNSGVGKPGTNGRNMAVIDLGSRKIVGNVDFGHEVRPHCAVFDAGHNRLYVTTELDHTVTIIDPRTLKILGSVPTGQAESHMFAISSDGLRGYTANVGPGTVSVLDLVKRKVITIIPVSAETQRISVSPDNSLVFTSDQRKPQLAVIDAAADKIKSWVPLPAVGYGTASTHDGRWLLVAMPDANQVAIIDLHSLKVARTIPVCGSPQEILVPPGSSTTAYVSCESTHNVGVLNLSSWSMQTTIDVGKGPDGLAWAAAH